MSSGRFSIVDSQRVPTFIPGACSRTVIVSWKCVGVPHTPPSVFRFVSAAGPLASSAPRRTPPVDLSLHGSVIAGPAKGPGRRRCLMSSMQLARSSSVRSSHCVASCVSDLESGTCMVWMVGEWE